MGAGVVGALAAFLAVAAHKQEYALIQARHVEAHRVLVLLRNPVILSHAALAVPEQHNV